MAGKDVEEAAEETKPGTRPIEKTFVDPAVDVDETCRTVEAGDGGKLLRFNPGVFVTATIVVVAATVWLAVHKPCDIQTLGTCSDSSIERMDACTDSYTWVAATTAGTCAGCVGDGCETTITTEAACEAQCQSCTSSYYPHDHRHHHSDSGHRHDDEDGPPCPCPCPVWQAPAEGHCVRGSDGAVYEDAATEEACLQTRTWTVDPDAEEIRHWNGTHFDGSHRGCPARGSWSHTEHRVVSPHADGSAGQQLGRWTNWAVEKTHWLQVFSKNGFLLMLGWCVYHHGNVKLGKQADIPAHSTPVWLGMIFTTAMGTSLLLFSVADPVARLAATSAGITDAEAQAALAGNFHQFGLHAWCCYSVFGLAAALATHRWGLPLSARSVVFQLLGRATFGWLGDIIDLLAVVATIFGVAAALGFAAIQLNTGLHQLHDGIEVGAAMQTVLTWLLMGAAATAALGRGLRGLQWLCIGCFCTGSCLLACVWLIASPWYLLAVLTQSTGHYLQWMLTLGTDADAFAAPAAADDNDAAAVSMAAAAAWSSFYWNWWIALAPAAGLFMARISAGRTVRQFVAATLLAPTLYCFVWVAVFGGATVELQRHAAAAGLAPGASAECALVQSSALAVGTNDGSAVTSHEWICGECPIKQHVSACAAADDCAYMYTHQPSTVTHLSGSTQSASAMWYSLLKSFGDIGGTLILLSVVVTAGFFLTSAAAGALVIDSVSSNGRGGSAAQLCFWAVLLAAVATALLHAGGADVLTVMMGSAALAGVPFMLLLPLGCLATARALRLDAAHHRGHGAAACADDAAADGNEWHQPLLHSLEAPSTANLAALAVSVLAPFIAVGTAHKQAAAAGGDIVSNHMLLLGLLTTMWFGFVGCVLVDWALVAHDSMWAIGWTCFLVFSCIVAAVRTNIRSVRSIDGSVIVDLVASVLTYPFAAAQMAAESDKLAAAAATRSAAATTVASDGGSA